jgi:hypothetical protein
MYALSRVFGKNFTTAVPVGCFGPLFQSFIKDWALTIFIRRVGFEVPGSSSKIYYRLCNMQPDH